MPDEKPKPETPKRDRPVDDELHDRLGQYMNDGSGAQNPNPPQPKK